MKTIIIDPVTRIEGHAKISIYLDKMPLIIEVINKNGAVINQIYRN